MREGLSRVCCYFPRSLFLAVYMRNFDWDVVKSKNGWFLKEIVYGRCFDVFNEVQEGGVNYKILIIGGFFSWNVFSSDVENFIFLL